MKTKLLKKVRKRFDIIWMPNGFTSFGERYEYNLYKLTDSNNSFYERFAQLRHKDGNRQFCKDGHIFQTKEECINHLKQCILNRLRSEGHLGRKDRDMNNSHIKVWYNKLK
jgi:hypothetical protein